MATRRVMVGDQEIEIPEFNFKITPVIIGAIVPVSYTHLTLPTILRV